MKKLERLAEARDEYQAGDLLVVRAAGGIAVAQIIEAEKEGALARVLVGLGVARRPSWNYPLERLDWGPVIGALPGPEVLDKLGLPTPPDVESVLATLKRSAESLKAEAKRKRERAKHMPDAARRVASVIRNRKQNTLDAAKRAEDQAAACLADLEVYGRAAKALAELAEKQAEAAQGEGEGDDNPPADNPPATGTGDQGKPQDTGQGQKPQADGQGQAGGKQPAPAQKAAGGQQKASGQKQNGRKAKAKKAPTQGQKAQGQGAKPNAGGNAGS